MSCSRRRALRLLAAAGATAATAGCLGSDTDAYALIADELDLSSIGRPYLWPDPTAIDATTRVDFATETKDSYLTKLFDT